jgi:hypothetical protein
MQLSVAKELMDWTVSAGMITGALGGKSPARYGSIIMILIFESPWSTTNFGNNARQYPCMGNCVELCRTRLLFISGKSAKDVDDCRFIMVWGCCYYHFILGCLHTDLLCLRLLLEELFSLEVSGVWLLDKSGKR